MVKTVILGSKPQGCHVMYQEEQGCFIYLKEQGCLIDLKEQGCHVTHSRSRDATLHTAGAGMPHVPEEQGCLMYPREQGCHVIPRSRDATLYPGAGMPHSPRSRDAS